MKINQVEELVGITKKNIRFYEDQGLITPNRNSENGYRDYSLDDVDRLNKIKLLRRLGVPIEQIRNMQEGALSFDECMENHTIHLSHEQRDLELTKEICRKLSEEVDRLDDVDPSKYFDEMKKLEEGGIRFMDVNNTDIIRKRSVSAYIISAVVILIMGIIVSVLLWAFMVENMPTWTLVVCCISPIVVIVGIIIALRQRIKEIKGGEVDEASKY